MQKSPRFTETNGFVSSKKSSSLMKRIQKENSQPEMLLRKALWKSGFRYRLHIKKLAGTPDIAIMSERIAIFVDGDFWHGYNWTRKKQSLKTNRGFWIPKIERTMQRDREVTLSLLNSKWSVIRFWEHEIRNDVRRCVDSIFLLINGAEPNT